MAVQEGLTDGRAPLSGDVPVNYMHGQIRADGRLYFERQDTHGSGQTVLYGPDGTALALVGGALPVATFAPTLAVVLNQTTPNPAGNPITVNGLPPTAADFAVRDTTARYFDAVIEPYRQLSIGAMFQNFDTAATLWLYATVGVGATILAALTIPATPGAFRRFVIGPWGAGTGSAAPLAAVADASYYEIPALAGSVNAVRYVFQFPTAPTVGDHHLSMVWRG